MRIQGSNIMFHFIIMAVGIVMLYPILWMIGSSFKPENEIFHSTGFLPNQWIFNNYSYGWNVIPGMPFHKFFENSFIITFGAIIGNLISCSMAAYAFARLSFVFKPVFFSLMMLTIMLPHQVTLVPQYIIFNKLGLINTFYPLIIPKFLAVDAFFVFLLVQFIRGLPRELDEAAVIDGCGPVRIFWRIIIPLTVPALITTAIFTFIWTYDDFFSQLLYLNDMSKYTVQLGLRLFVDSSSNSAWGSLFAMSVLSLVPILIVFLVCQKYFVQGIATSGIK